MDRHGAPHDSRSEKLFARRSRRASAVRSSVPRIVRSARVQMPDRHGAVQRLTGSATSRQLPIASPADASRHLDGERVRRPANFTSNAGCSRTPASAGSTFAISGTDSLSDDICRLKIGVVK